MSKCTRVALVGCGWFARVAHIPALQRLERESWIRLVGLCSRSEELGRACKPLVWANGYQALSVA